MKTFEDFLRDCLDRGDTVVRLGLRYDEHMGLRFYAHGQGGSTSGETFNGMASREGVFNMEQPSNEAAIDRALVDAEADEEENLDIAEATLERLS